MNEIDETLDFSYLQNLCENICDRKISTNKRL